MEERCLTIFAGAGASKAVDPKKYPTTVEFFENLPDEITTNSLFKLIVEFLTLRGKDGIVDIELVLWRLEEIAKFCNLAGNANELPAWMLDANRLVKATGLQGQNVGHLKQIAQTSLQQIDKLRDSINEQVYAFYSQLPGESNLDNTWVPLLRPLLMSQSKVELVTTNYDVVLEAALDVLAKDINVSIDTGWRGTIHRTLDADLWTQQSRKGLLTKLHGSVNWTRDSGQIYIGDPTFKGSHKNHAIIYPGFKGRPAHPMFQSFHAHFRNALQVSDKVLFIGFAFRDEYINDLCERTVGSESTIITIDPSAEVSLPFAHAKSKTKYIRRGFDSQSVTEALQSILGV